MSETTQQHNARCVVKTWADNNHTGAWGTAAHERSPSWLILRAAEAQTEVSRTADRCADALLVEGFLPGHAEVRTLRGIASTAAQAANRLNQWADALAEAEMEMP